MERSFGRCVAELSALVLLLFFLSLLLGKSSANVVLIGNNISLSFDDIEANFAPEIKGSGICGILQLAEPPDACTPLTNKAVSGEGANSPFVLISRGLCTFEKKVRNAQDAGFSAAIVSNNEDGGDLISSGCVVKAVVGLANCESETHPINMNSQKEETNPMHGDIKELLCSFKRVTLWLSLSFAE